MRRAYFFTNYYLSSIQQGIQPLHAIVELSLAPEHTSQHLQYHDWAKNHKTVVCLNGGNSADLSDLINFFSTAENPYAWSFFKEDQASLNEALTSVAIILPERIYGAAQALRSREVSIVNLVTYGIELNGISHTNYSEWELQLIELLNSCGLAK